MHPSRIPTASSLPCRVAMVVLCRKTARRRRRRVNLSDCPASGRQSAPPAASPQGNPCLPACRPAAPPTAPADGPADRQTPRRLASRRVGRQVQLVNRIQTFSDVGFLPCRHLPVTSTWYRSHLPKDGRTERKKIGTKKQALCMIYSPGNEQDTYVIIFAEFTLFNRVLDSGALFVIKV
ncbi:Protein of unknown function [Gryllus bimaculatus]|nr:Protein of unknown function [Gryllus bimaculatus]